MKSREIVDLAAEIVQIDGLGKISFRNLADAVGVKSSSVHYHFRTKADLIETLICDYSVNFEKTLNELDEQDFSVRDRILWFAGIFKEVLSNDKLCLCGVMAVSVNELNEPSRNALSDFFSKAGKWLETTLKEGRGEIKMDLSTKDLARLILSGLEGSILLDRVDRGDKNLQSQLAFIEALFE